MSGTRSLILGLWTRNPFWPLEKFFASLYRTAFEGDVCVFVDDVPAETVRLLHAHGVIVERPGRAAISRMVPLSSRFFYCLDFLARHADRYDKVMLSDMRDVVFQADPFAAAWPAEIIYAQERCIIDKSPVNRAWVMQGYGDGVARTMGDCLVSCAGTTFGTTDGVLRYLIAMTHEMSRLATDITGGIDQGIHNYIVRMRPLRGAWFDHTDSIAATMGYVPNDAIEVTDSGVLVDGKLVPVLHQWDRNPITRDYVQKSGRFRLTPADAKRGMRPRGSPRNAVIFFYRSERDADWLDTFLGSLRAIGHRGDIHCIGELDEDERRVLAHFGCVSHAPPGEEVTIDPENLAHFCFALVLEQLAADAGACPDQVMVFDTARIGFVRDPFEGATIGLSVFAEGPIHLGDSDYNFQRLAHFGAATEEMRERPVVSSAIFRGPVPVLLSFYRQVLGEYVDRADLLRIQKGIQGAVNKYCHMGKFDFPISIHPNASEVYFEMLPLDLRVMTDGNLLAGDVTPALIVNPFAETKLMQALKLALRLESRAEILKRAGTGAVG